MQAHSKETEKAMVGIMVNYPEEDFSIVCAEDFYLPTYQLIAKAIIALKNLGEKYDATSIYEYCKNYFGEGVKVTDLTEVMNGDYSLSAIKSHIVKLKEYSRKREANRIAQEIVELSNGDPAKLMEYSTKLALASTIGSSNEQSVSYDDVTKAYDQVTSRFGKTLYGYSWGKELAFLDEISKGIVKKRVYRVGGVSNSGKSQMMYNVITSLLTQTNLDGTPVKVAFFTLENTKEDTLVSLMCNHCGLNANLVNSGAIEGNWDYLVGLKDRLFIIDDVYEVDKIFSKCISIKPDVVILDYITHITIQKASGMEKYDMYAEKVPKFAKRQDLAWIDLSNLPKNLQTNDEIRASPGFYGSSILMNNCDFAIHIMRNQEFRKTKETVLHNPKATHEDKQYFYTRNCLDLLITKNRWGSVFVDKTYGINFSNGGKWRELSETDLNSLWAKYG